MSTQIFSGRTFFITGASRGIGRSIALKAAENGANVVIAAKTDKPHPKLSGTIFSVAEEVEKLGGKALPVVVDVRDDNSIDEAVSRAVEKFGGIDVLVNNASAIILKDIEQSQMKHVDLMLDVNSRGSYSCIRACAPYLKKSPQAHIITMSPPINLNPKWLGISPAYALSKYGMTLVTLGAAAEMENVQANTLWPQTLIGTAAIEHNFPERYPYTRSTDIVADAVYELICTMPKSTTGQSLTDEEILRQCGYDNFEIYRTNSGAEPAIDLFLDPEV